MNSGIQPNQEQAASSQLRNAVRAPLTQAPPVKRSNKDTPGSAFLHAFVAPQNHLFE